MNETMVKTRFGKGFYEKRSIAVPRREWWPESAGELRELVVGSQLDTPALLVGDGQHVRTSVVGERRFDVIRTERCRRVIAVDRPSKMVRVESGIRWGELQEELATRGLSAERYRLYPWTATLGGLLGRHQPVHREMWDGDLMSGCVALSGVTPTSGEYDYLAAPRKASGPDLRSLFVGSEGLLGAILDVTLVALAPSDGRLYRFEAPELGTALRAYKVLHDLGIRLSWAWWGSGRLEVAIHGHHRVLKSVGREIAEHIALPHEVGGRDELADRRVELEKGHPERRTLATARRSVSVHLGLHDLVHGLEVLEESAESIEVWDWTRHRARAIVRFRREAVPTELPTATAAVALASHPLLDDEAVHWPHWSQVMKGELDPGRVLAVGP